MGEIFIGYRYLGSSSGGVQRLYFPGNLAPDSEGERRNFGQIEEFPTKMKIPDYECAKYPLVRALE